MGNIIFLLYHVVPDATKVPNDIDLVKQEKLKARITYLVRLINTVNNSYSLIIQKKTGFPVF